MWVNLTVLQPQVCIDNNTTTNVTYNKTVNTEGEQLSNRKETMFKNMFFSVSRYVSTPGQYYASQTSEGTFFWWERNVFMFLSEKNVPVDITLCCNFFDSKTNMQIHKRTFRNNFFGWFLLELREWVLPILLWRVVFKNNVHISFYWWTLPCIEYLHKWNTAWTLTLFC